MTKFYKRKCLPVGLFKKDTVVLDEKNKKIRLVVMGIGVILIALILIMNLLLGFGRKSRAVVYYRDGKNVIYDIKKDKVIDGEYMCFNSSFVDFSKTGAGVFKAHYDSDISYRAEKNGNSFDIYYTDKKGNEQLVAPEMNAMRFAQNGKDCILFKSDKNGTYDTYFVSDGNVEHMFDGCSDAMAVGNKKSRYYIFNKDNKAMFFNFKKEPYDMGTGNVDADTLSISADDRKLMAVSEGDRKLYVLNINNVEDSTANGLEVGENVIKASFTGLKSDFAFLDASGDFYYSSNGYTFKEDENVKKFEAGFDVMTMYYLKENGDFYSIYVGDEKKLDEGIEDFAYAGSNSAAVIKDFDKKIKQGDICYINKHNITEIGKTAEKFKRY